MWARALKKCKSLHSAVQGLRQEAGWFYGISWLPLGRTRLPLGYPGSVHHCHCHFYSNKPYFTMCCFFFRRMYFPCASCSCSVSARAAKAWCNSVVPGISVARQGLAIAVSWLPLLHMHDLVWRRKVKRGVLAAAASLETTHFLRLTWTALLLKH